MADEDGFEVPVHRSLAEPILIGGVPRTVALLNGTFCFALFLGMHSFWALVVGAALHFLFAYASKKDAQWFEIFKEHIKEQDQYLP